MPRQVPQQLLLPTGKSSPQLTHRLFRYPAKFHPPVVDALLTRYTRRSDVVLDPFCGSGTVLVEASRLGRRAIGSDVDPLAIYVSRAKTRDYDLSDVCNAADLLLGDLKAIERSGSEYVRFIHEDLDDGQYQAEVKGLWVPAIPNLLHWFRKYVVVDLARMRQTIATLQCDVITRDLFRVVFASIIRQASNADPVPVSGLEVTAHMKRRDREGRLINPFAMFRIALRRALRAVRESSGIFDPAPDVSEADATALDLSANIDAVVTSPPYQNAVDYYRRHQLEMYWLELTRSHSDRLKLLPRYIGRPRLPESHPMLLKGVKLSPTAQSWFDAISAADAGRARDFQAYVSAMRLVFERLSPLMSVAAPAIFVVGRSGWNGDFIPTDRLFVEMAAPYFELSEQLVYPVKNRHMSYTRHNGANISEEHVLVLRKTNAKAWME